MRITTLLAAGFVAWSVLSPARADAACPDLQVLVRSAQADFDDAEVDRAASSIDAAYQSLTCQTTVVTTEQLLSLYRLDALVSLAQGDRKSAQYAVIRSVVADPDAAPPESYGPELTDLHETWRARLQGTEASVRIEGGGRVWIDGRPVTRGSGNTVVQGEHLLQFNGASGWTSEVRDVGLDTRIDTGLPESDDDLDPHETPKKHKSVALLVGGLAVGAAGGGSLGFAYSQELAFHQDPYQANAYFGCDRTRSCYAQARGDQIRQDATLINVFYGIGYGLVAAGAGLVLADLAIPSPTTDKTLSLGAAPLPGGGVLLGTVAF